MLARTHGWPAVGQVQPDSTPQNAEQPSPETVLPSSQASPRSTMPLPHTSSGTQGAPVRGQAHPDSTALQSPAQPSPLAEPPSSHASPLSIRPLPHTPSGTHAAPALGHAQPASTA